MSLQSISANYNMFKDIMKVLKQGKGGGFLEAAHVTVVAKALEYGLSGPIKVGKIWCADSTLKLREKGLFEKLKVVEEVRVFKEYQESKRATTPYLLAASACSAGTLMSCYAGYGMEDPTVAVVLGASCFAGSCAASQVAKQAVYSNFTDYVKMVYGFNRARDAQGKEFVPSDTKYVGSVREALCSGSEWLKNDKI